MIIDCARCVGRPTECDDCVISVVLGSAFGLVDLDADEQTAVAVLAGSGLVPPLRLMPLPVAREPDPAERAPGAERPARPARGGRGRPARPLVASWRAPRPAGSRTIRSVAGSAG